MKKDLMGVSDILRYDLDEIKRMYTTTSKQFTFVHLFCKRFRKPWGWYCLIEDMEDMVNWSFKSGIENEIAKGVLNVLESDILHDCLEDSDENKEFKKAHPYRHHLNNDLSFLLFTKLRSMADKEEEKTGKPRVKASFSFLSNYASNIITECRFREVSNGNKIVINKNNGWFVLSDSYEIDDTKYCDEYVFPCFTEKDIVVKQWTKGTHYYAKVGNKDVVDKDGKMKWDTYDEAKEQALMYLKRYIGKQEE